MRNALVTALRSRGMNVVTALEEGMIGRDDNEHLDHATRQRRVPFSFNRGDFFRLHTQYLSSSLTRGDDSLPRRQSGELPRSSALWTRNGKMSALTVGTKCAAGTFPAALLIGGLSAGQVGQRERDIGGPGQHLEFAAGQRGG